MSSAGPPAVSVLVALAILAPGWATDYRFETLRAQGSARNWASVLANWEHRCAKDPGGTIRVGARDLPPNSTEPIACSRILT